jgi:hypothetical protein
VVTFFGQAGRRKCRHQYSEVISCVLNVRSDDVGGSL